MTLLLALALTAAPADAAKDAAKDKAADGATSQTELTVDGTKAYEYREEVFHSMGNHMKALSMMVKGQIPARKDDMVAHATALNAMSSIVPHIFPRSSGPDSVPETEALKTIWEDPEGFQQAAAAFQEKSAALVTAAQSGEMATFKPAFAATGKTCGGCHDGFRKDED